MAEVGRENSGNNNINVAQPSFAAERPKGADRPVHQEDFLKEKDITSNNQTAEAAQNTNVDPTSTLTLFSERYPEISSTLSATTEHYKALKAAQSDGNLISPTTFDHVKGLYNAYIQDKSPKNRVLLTDFAEALRLPKFAYEVIVYFRTNYEELTSWDRERERTKSDEGGVSKITVSGGKQVAFQFVHDNI